MTNKYIIYNKYVIDVNKIWVTFILIIKFMTKLYPCDSLSISPSGFPSAESLRPR